VPEDRDAVVDDSRTRALAPAWESPALCDRLADG